MRYDPNLPNTILHQAVTNLVGNILEMANIRYDLYRDPDSSTNTLPSIYGYSIKFWNIFPKSGTSVDSALYTINFYLQMHYGLYAAYHVYQPSDNVPSIISLVIKPIPTML
jgi:hypothetical protein